MVKPRPMGGNRNHLDTHSELMRFDNIDEGPDEEGTIAVSPAIEPDASRGYSLAEEPAIVLLPDGRLWMNMRTVWGSMWYTVSDDDGHSWRPTEPMLYRDGDTGPWDMEAWRPVCIAVGQFRPGAHQPIWFSQAKLLMDTQRVRVGTQKRMTMAMYSSLTEREGERIVWYADRKQFVVGKEIPDEMLAHMTVQT